MATEHEVSLTFDDVLLRPDYAGFLPEDIDIGSQFSKNIRLESPFVSAPMDMVTEQDLAIALAEQGGIGIIHRNLTSQDQADQVRAVKDRGLLVGAAVGTRPGYKERSAMLVESGVDAIVVDTAHGYAKVVIDAIRYLKHAYPAVDVIGGNIATREAAKVLSSEGADGLRVGMGPGAICTTRIVSGMGVPQLKAIQETADCAKIYEVPIIADGGINSTGDIVKALAAGASTVMMGRLFASTNESPGEVVIVAKDKVPARFQSIVNGKLEYAFKQYRGMGSVGAMQRGREISSEDEFHGKDLSSATKLHPEGVEGLVPLTGSVKDAVEEMVEGLKQGMYYTGSQTIHDLWDTVFQRITDASLRESHPHDLYVQPDSSNGSTT